MTVKTMSFTHHPRVSLTQFSFCWWRHNRLLLTSQWPDDCDGITWIVISNSLDIDFIHGDIHGWSCKKDSFIYYVWSRLSYIQCYAILDRVTVLAWYSVGWLYDDTCTCHDVIKWKHFPRYWPFVRGIHRSPVNSLHKGQWRGALYFLWSAPK